MPEWVQVCAVLVTIGVMLGALIIVVPYASSYLNDKLREAREKSNKKPSPKTYEEGRQEGYAEALAVLVDTDENAAIIEALGTNTVLLPMGVERTGGGDPNVALGWSLYGSQYRELGWLWRSADFERAKIRAVGATPRAAYRAYMAQRQAVSRICAQLDEVERIKAEAKQEAQA